MANFFPRWTNWLPLKMAICSVVIVCGLTAGTWYYVTPKYTRSVTSRSSRCRFRTIFTFPNWEWIAVIATALSMSRRSPTCRTRRPAWRVITQVQKDNPKLEPVRDSWKTGKPIEWVRLHRTPDYVYYNHAAHVNRGISCSSCHGAVNHMPVVYHAKPHSMAWCLECHRHPENFLRPEDQITNLDWKPEDVNPAEFVAQVRPTERRARRLVEKEKANPT